MPSSGEQVQVLGMGVKNVVIVLPYSENDCHVTPLRSLYQLFTTSNMPAQLINKFLGRMVKSLMLLSCYCVILAITVTLLNSNNLAQICPFLQPICRSDHGGQSLSAHRSKGQEHQGKCPFLQLLVVGSELKQLLKVGHRESRSGHPG